MILEMLKLIGLNEEQEEDKGCNFMDGQSLMSPCHESTLTPLDPNKL